MKRTCMGWAGKTGEWIADGSFHQRDVMVFTTRGHKQEWSIADWPPVRVKVTVETMGKTRKDSKPQPGREVK